MPNRFTVLYTSVLKDKKYFVLEGKIARGHITTGMNLQYTGTGNDLSLLPVSDISFTLRKSGTETVELISLCVPYENTAMLNALDDLELVNRTFRLNS